MSVTASIISAIVSSVIDSVVDAPAVVPVDNVQSAMMRTFPQESRKGQWTPPVQQGVVINGTVLPAAPGLQIRNEQNLIVLPGALQSTGTLPVRYQLDPMGNVWRLWILTAAERAAPDTPQ